MLLGTNGIYFPKIKLTYLYVVCDKVSGFEKNWPM